jgi:hypothetical protein
MIGLPMQIDIVAYLRDMASRCGEIARACPDPAAKTEIEKLRADLAEKCQTIETLFEIPETLK